MATVKNINTGLLEEVEKPTQELADTGFVPVATPDLNKLNSDILTPVPGDDFNTFEEPQPFDVAKIPELQLTQPEEEAQGTVHPPDRHGHTGHKHRPHLHHGRTPREQCLLEERGGAPDLSRGRGEQGVGPDRRSTRARAVLPVSFLTDEAADRRDHRVGKGDARRRGTGH